MRFSRRALAAGVVGAAVLAAGALLWSEPWLVGIGRATPDDLRAASWRVAARLPLMIDPETRLEHAETGDGLEQVFRFRLVARDAGDPEVAGAGPRLRERARNGICGKASLAPLVSRGVSVTYVYVDREGREAIRFSVDPLDCLWQRLRAPFASGTRA